MDNAFIKWCAENGFSIPSGEYQIDAPLMMGGIKEPTKAEYLDRVHPASQSVGKRPTTSGEE